MKQVTGFKHLMNSTRYSMAGLAAAWHETAFRHELLAGLVLLPAAWLLPHLTLLWRVVLTLTWMSMPALELLNTAIEAVVDLVSPEHHPLAGKAKDLGSAAVFVAICGNCLVWGAALVEIARLWGK